MKPIRGFFFAILPLLIATGLRAGTVLTYDITVNTNGVTSDMGYLDFEFNEGPFGADDALATISGFSTDGTLGADGGSFGVTGVLPGTVTIDNQALNDYNTGVTFGSFFDVFVTLDVPTVSGTALSGSSFTLGLYEPNDATLYLTNPNPLVEIDLDTDGNPTVTNNSPDGEATVAQMPEPASFTLVLCGAMSLFLVVGRRCAAAARSSLSSRS